MTKILIRNVPTPKQDGEIKVKKTLQPTDRNKSNMEIEKGEFVVSDTMHTGFPETYVAGGQPHSNGGTPVNLPENSFIFSKDKSLKLKDEEVQKSFGQKEKKTGYVFADIAKKYNVNDYRKVLADPDSDNLQRDTAEQMIKNYNEKLGKLALVQESMKGMPQGIPFISVPYLESMGIDPAQFVHGGNGDEPEVPTQQEEQDTPQMKKGGSFKIKVLKKPFLPKAQDGKQVSKDMPAYDPQEQAVLAYFFPGTSTSKEVIPKQQSKKSSGPGYGTFNEDAANKNWEWYGKVDWNNPMDVKKAGEAYNTRIYDKAVKAGYGEKFAQDLVNKVGFLTTPGQINSLENKPGKGGLPGGYYGSRVDINLPEKRKVGITQHRGEDTEQTDQNPLQYQGFDTRQIQQDNPFWTQDIVNMAGAFGDLQRIKKYMPWQAGYSTQLPEGIYYDPTRELVASAEQANISAQALGAFAGPQSLSARLSEIQGQGLENAANILGKYNNLNVGEANALESTRKNILNSASANRADQATGLFDKTTMVNQQFDNARAEARQKLRQSFIDAWTNRGKTQALNVMNKQYKVDPRTGYVSMTGVPGQITGAGQSAQIEDTFNKLMKNPNLKANPEIAYKLALKAHGQE